MLDGSKPLGASGCYNGACTLLGFFVVVITKKQHCAIIVLNAWRIVGLKKILVLTNSSKILLLFLAQLYHKTRLCMGLVSLHSESALECTAKTAKARQQSCKKGTLWT